MSLSPSGAFTRWLLDQADRDDPVGDLARDARSDPNFPEGTVGQVLDYLSTPARRGAREAFIEALEEYLS